jgi:hypothetical protein
VTEFIPFPKIARLNRECIVTEKIDGTNAVVSIGEDGSFQVGSRSKWITPEDDNHGFARWAYANRDCLMQLGPGLHHGEWWGQGIQRKYGLTEKRFSLFNTTRWGAERPECCHVVPVLARGIGFTPTHEALNVLRSVGSVAAPGFDKPEGIVVYHAHGNVMFKVTLERDEEPKGKL